MENCLLRKLEDIFTGKTVIGMDDQQIEEIAAEPPKVRNKRKRLEDDLKRLREAMRALSSLDVDDPLTRAFRVLGGFMQTSKKSESLADKDILPGQNRDTSPELHKPNSQQIILTI